MDLLAQKQTNRQTKNKQTNKKLGKHDHGILRNLDSSSTLNLFGEIL